MTHQSAVLMVLVLSQTLVFVIVAFMDPHAMFLSVMENIRMTPLYVVGLGHAPLLIHVLAILIIQGLIVEPFHVTIPFTTTQVFVLDVVLVLLMTHAYAIQDMDLNFVMLILVIMFHIGFQIHALVMEPALASTLAPA